MQRARHHAHGSPGAVAGTEAKNDPARSKLVEGSNRIRRHRCDAGADDSHASAQFDPLGLLGDQPQTEIRVTSHHLRIAHPDMAESTVLSESSLCRPQVRFGQYANTKIHKCPLFASCFAPSRLRRECQSDKRAAASSIVFSSFPEGEETWSRGARRRTSSYIGPGSESITDSPTTRPPLVPRRYGCWRADADLFPRPGQRPLRCVQDEWSRPARPRLPYDSLLQRRTGVVRLPFPRHRRLAGYLPPSRVVCHGYLWPDQTAPLGLVSPLRVRPLYSAFGMHLC